MTDSTTATNTATGTVCGPGAVRERLDQAHGHLAAAAGVLTARVPDPATLHAAVDGAIRLANALADLVTTVMCQAPAGLDHSACPNTDPSLGTNTGPILDELLADLRAMRGCLTTAPLLLAPARDDLHRLIINHGTTPATYQEGGPAMLGHKPNDPFDSGIDDAAPAGDVADQQRPPRPEPTGHDEILDSAREVLDADPADIADQRRDAPVLDEIEPWP